MSTRARKSSTHVALVLIGAAAALSGCGDTELRRNFYASKEDCVADWGDPKECEESTASWHGGRGGRVWFGPSYSYGAGGTAPHSAHSIGSTSVSRGGFGASGHAHSSGGS